MSISERRVILFVVFFMISVATTMAQSVFNGKMVMKTQWGSSSTIQQTLYTQSGNLRVDMNYSSGMNMYKIIKNSSMYTIYPASKRCISAKLKSPVKSGLPNGNSDQSQSGSGKSVNNAEVAALWKKTLTGKTRKILGHTCYEHVLPSGDGGSTDMWVARDIALDSREKSSINIIASGAFFFNKLGTYFPLLLEDIGKDGKVNFKFEVESISTKKLAGSIFEIPKGCTK